MTQLQRDAVAHPGVFQFAGPLSRPELDRALGRYAAVVPEDLVQLWCDLGGGDFFESETLLSPRPRIPTEDDLLETNRYLWQRGLPPHYLVFHVGIRLTAIQPTDQPYIVLHPETFAEEGSYGSVEDWYIQTVRKELGWRYGIGPPDDRRGRGR